MANNRHGSIPSEALINLRRRLEDLPSRHPDRKNILESVATLYGVSRATVYRQLREQLKPKGVRRADRGKSRKIIQNVMERYCEIIAALKIRTSNKKGRHLSTVRAIELLEEHGVETPDGIVRPPVGLLNRTTVNRYLKEWGYDHARMTRVPAAVRFQARQSNEMWQFDLSPSDLKKVKRPLWLDPMRGDPTLMLYSVVDDRSGVCYQEYHCVYGEDVEAALRFLFNAMTIKPEEGFVFQGIPKAIYLDNGPITRSQVFQNVMDRLGVRLMKHLPAGKDGRRPTARSKGKVERPFRTVKEAHETLYHFHEPENEAEANLWLHRYLMRYNAQPHRSEQHSRLDDWMHHLPEEGIQEMCSWDRFCTFAREPEGRQVGIDARLTVNGVVYEVDSGLAGEKVILWWGLFDQDLYVEYEERRYGPYSPSGGPIQLHKYRRHKKSKLDERADRVAALAEKLNLPRSALDGNPGLAQAIAMSSVSIGAAIIPFVDKDPFHELSFRDRMEAKRAISDDIGIPLAKLNPDGRAFIDSLLQETLKKADVLKGVRAHFKGET